MTTYALESDLVSGCRAFLQTVPGIAYLELVGQRRAKGSGSTVGFPDGVLYCNGQVRLLEFKRADGGRLSRGQELAMACRAEQGVETHVVTSVQQFADLVGACRRGR